MTNPIAWTKSRLSTVSTESRRYRLATSIWSDYKVERSKACSFYWIYLPTSAIGISLLYLVVGAICAGAWVCGRIPTFVEDRGQGGLDSDMLYPYRYHPRSGKKGRFAPWQFLLPAVVLWLGVTWYQNGTLSTLFSAIISFLSDSKWWLIGIAISLGGLYLVGTLIKQLRRPIIQKWNAVCPPLHVVHNQDTNQAA